MPTSPTTPDVIINSAWLGELLRQYIDTANKLIDVQQQLAAKQHDDLMTLDEVCAFTKLSHKTIKLRMADVPVIADGAKIVRFFRSDIIAWCQSRKITYAELIEQKPQTGRSRKR